MKTKKLAAATGQEQERALKLQLWLWSKSAMDSNQEKSLKSSALVHAISLFRTSLTLFNSSSDSILVLQTIRWIHGNTLKMSTVEKLFVQIFERKKSIIDRVKHQVHLFDQHLASKLLIDGITPPPWLFPPVPNPQNTDLNEFNVEELIPGVRKLHTQPGVPFSSSHCSIYEKPVTAAQNRELLNDLCTEIKKGFYAGDETMLLPLHCISDAGCASNHIPAPEDCSMFPEGQRDCIMSPEDQRDARCSDANPGPALSLARIQRSRSRQKALELRNSAKAAKFRLQDENNAGDCAGGSVQSDQLFGLNLVNPLGTDNDTCAVEDAEVGGCLSSEKETTVYSSKTASLKISDQKHSSLNVGNSSCAVREDGATLADSTSISAQRYNHVNQPLELDNDSNHVNQPLELDKHSNHVNQPLELPNQSHAASKEGSNIYLRRITRSSPSHQANCASELFKLDDSSSNGQVDGISNLIRQPKVADETELVKSFDATEENPTMEAKAKGYGSKEHRTNDYHGRITRSRSSNKPCNTVHDLSKLARSSPGEKNLDLCPINGKEHFTKGNAYEEYVSRGIESHGTCSSERISKAENLDVSSQILSQSTFADSKKSLNGKGTQLSAGRSFLVRKDLEQCAANSTDSSEEETIEDECAGKNTRIEATSATERILKPVNSHDLGCRVTRFRSAASNKSQLAKSLDRCQGVEYQEVSNAKVKDPPCTSTCELLDVGRRAATVEENEIDYEQVEAHSTCSMSNSDSVGLEVLAPKPLTDCSMLFNPKQLIFDDVEESSLNAISTYSLKRKTQGRSSEQRPLTLLEPAGVLDKVRTVNYQEKCNSSPEMPLLEEQEVLRKEEEPQRGVSEANAEEIEKEVRALNGSAISSVKEISDIHKDIDLQTSLKNDRTSNKKSSLTEHSTTVRVACECPLGSSLKEVMASHLCTDKGDTRINVSAESDNRVFTVEHSKLVSEESKQDTHYFGDPNLVKDADFFVVTSPGVLGNVSVYRDFTAADSLPHNRDVTEVGCSKSTENKIEEKSSSNSSVEGSWTMNKRRKIGLVDTQSAWPEVNEDAIHTMNSDFMCKDLPSEEYNPRAIPESQKLSIFGEDVSQLISSGNKIEIHQIKEQNVTAGSELSPKLQVEESYFSLKGEKTSADAPFTFIHGELRSSLVSSLIRQVAGDFQGNLVEETRAVDSTSIIFDAENQCATADNRVSFHLHNHLGLGNTEPLTCRKRLLQEKMSCLEGMSKFSYCSIGSPHSADEKMPVLEGFIMQTDGEVPCIDGEGIGLDKLKLPTPTIESSCMVEQLCKPPCVQTPVSYSSASLNLHRVPNVFQSVPNGLLEGIDLRTRLPTNNTVKQLKNDYGCLSEVSCAFNGRSYSDCLPDLSGQSGWDIKKPCTSPIGKLWDRITSTYGSSEKRQSLNPELPCISEENENAEEMVDTVGDGIFSKVLTSSVIRKPLANITGSQNLPASEAEPCVDRCSLDSVNTEFSFTGTHNRVRKKLGTRNSNKRATGSLHNRFNKPKLSGKTSLRKGGPLCTEVESKHNNIVSNITSFIPLVQQKQAAAVLTGKREIKVKALEAAEAAKRLAEKRDNERKIKKEALKVERARLEQENLRQLELQKKRKEEERKKKEADMAARKRQREEEERKEKERKRMRVEEARKQQREYGQKLRAEKEGKVLKCRATDEREHEMNEPKDEGEKHENMEKGQGCVDLWKISETEQKTRVSSDGRGAGIVHEELETSSDMRYNRKVMNNLEEPTGNEILVSNTRKEQSYEISPYKESDDEDDDDNDLPNSKFIPYWASKNCLSLLVSSQNGVDPEVIFPPDSFCSFDEVGNTCLGKSMGFRKTSRGTKAAKEFSNVLSPSDSDALYNTGYY
ncbi:hypothetical protein FNV43_RR03743 [Rhamnella rubrinervis]|uniref:Inner centromere protein ARK-binding domain-containing protein n=1 Tax=Rhamnella rubrinervis TaxID=2594499 RepID=A0A8K0HJP3_9ROSA|nr:hypothetical protein FNV43_RR03743 [Rhamnella rubrinervis]